MKTTRRSFLKLTGAAAALGSLGITLPARAATARIVVIGGGFGGATCAKYLRMLDDSLEVTLVERDSAYATCPFSNLVLGGLKTMDDITQGYGALQEKYGVKFIQGSATGVDPQAQKVMLADGQTLAYDRLVVAPGIDLRFDAIEGYDAAASTELPHAWRAGPQTVLLRSQLEAMPDGGLVIIAPPGNPYRCPPGPYERACMIAHYLKAHKPKSKILILDAKDKFAKQGLFTAGWEALYPGMIEWVPGSEGGIVERVDAKARTLYANSGFDEHQGDVINFIPPQTAGAIAHQADLADESGWCPVNQLTFESTRHPGVHVIGDAAIAGKMPKSGFSANSQAKVCAAGIVTALAGGNPSEPSYANTCYSLVGPEYGISVSAVYRLQDGAIGPVKGAGGVSPGDASETFRSKEASYTHGWYASITADAWG